MTPRAVSRWGSVRWRTTILATTVVAVALVAASVALLAILEHSLTANDDTLSRARVDDLVQRVQDGTLPAAITNVGDDSVAQVIAPDGDVLAASSGLAGQGPISLDRPAPGEMSVQDMHNVPDDSETESYRVWSTSVPTKDGQVSVFVGASLESVSEAVSVLRHSLLVAVPAIVALVAVGTIVVVGRALRPVEAMRQEVASISAEDLDRRVPVPANEDEIQRLAVTMNATLDRLEAAQRRQREFVADASHELKSPIAGFRAELEVTRAHPDSVDPAELAEMLLPDVDRMENLVQDMLFLARDDDGLQSMQAVPLDLDAVIAEEVARTLPADGVRFDTTGLKPAPTRGDRSQLARLFRNLIDNAASYATSTVWVSSRVLPDGGVQASVEDDGPGVPPEHRQHVFERFARLDSSRSRSSGGAGLGLAIARGIAQRHGGTLVLRDGTRSATGARIELTLGTRQ